MKNKILITRRGSIGDEAIVAIAVYCLAKQHPEYDITVQCDYRWRHIINAIPFDNVHQKSGNIEFFTNVCVQVWVEDVVLKNGFEKVVILDNIPKPIQEIIALLLTKNNVLYSFKKSIVCDMSNKSIYNKYHNQRQIKYFIDAFKNVGIDVKLDFKSIYKDKPNTEYFIEKNTKWIGIGGISSIKDKDIPVWLCNNIIKEIQNKYPNYKVIIFGKKEHDFDYYKLVCKDINDVVFIWDYVNSLDKELPIIANCDVMISADTSNGHLAALCGVPTITVWGSTNPRFGWSPYGKNHIDIIPKIDCHPCSVAGRYKGNYNKEFKCNGKMFCYNTINVKDIIYGIDNFIK